MVTRQFLHLALLALLAACTDPSTAAYDSGAVPLAEGEDADGGGEAADGGTDGDDGGGDDDGVGDTVEPELPVVEDCVLADGDFLDLIVEDTRIPSVLRVVWRSAQPMSGRVSYLTPEGRPMRSLPGVVGTEHSALVVGLPTDTNLSLVASLTGADGTICSDAVDARTGTLPSDYPNVQIERMDPEVLDGHYIGVPVISTRGTWLAVYDDHGRPVWMWRAALGEYAGQSPVFRVRISPDGKGLLFNGQGDASDAPGVIGFVSWDAGSVVLKTVISGHTDFDLLPDGGTVLLGWTVRDFSRRRLLADTVIELRPDGTQRELWNVFDHFSPDLSIDYATGFLPDDPTVEDWSHVNGISYDGAQDDILITIPVINGVVRIDRDSASQVWAVSADSDDFTLPRGASPIEWPHGVQATADGLLVFNRNDWISTGGCSEVVDLRVDEARGVVNQTAAYTGETCQQVGFLGNAERMVNGNTVVSWSSAGVLDVTNAAGSLAWRLRSDLGGAFGFASPALLVQDDSRGSR